MNEKTLRKLEYHKILEEVSHFAVSSTAKQKILNTVPQTDFDQAEKLIALTQEALTYINYTCVPEFGFDDLTDAAQKARIESTLTMKELLRVMRLLRLSRNFKSVITGFVYLENAILKDDAYRVYSDKILEEDIDRSIISEDEMSDNASDELLSIRRAIKKTNADIRAKLQSYTKSKNLAPYLQDAIVTIREGRYVIPVKQEHKGAVEGLVHDQSASGSTLFIEPMAIVELNNQLKTLAARERDEIERILSAFTKRVALIADCLLTNQQIISDADVAFAKARYAISISAVKPLLNKRGYCKIINGRHPMLSKDKVVPVTTYIGKDFNILVITGPNTGGKTVTLKIIGLFCLMAYSGIFLPASDGTEVAFYDNIFCDIGDEQSIEQSLSTFSSHIKNISEILENLTSNTLILLDELCAGTEPNEGSALALAITEYIRESGAKAALTTHYGLLKEYSLVTEGVENASMEFDPVTYAPTYRLVMGVPGSSNAIEIATRLGLNKRVIEIARSNISTDKQSLEKVLQNAERIRKEYLDKKEEIAKTQAEIEEELAKAKSQNKLLLEEREKLLKNSRLQAKRIVTDAQEEAKKILDELKEIVKRAQLDEKSLFTARKVAKMLENTAANAMDDSEDKEHIFQGENLKPENITVGMTVYAPKLNSTVEVVTIEKNGKIRVRKGSITTSLSANELYEYADASKPKKPQRTLSTGIRKKTARTEINLLGMTVPEAIIEVDNFIDEALLNGLSEIKIIHGVGTGKLKKGLHEHFKIHPNVAEFRQGLYGEGEAGVTIIRLK